MAQAGERGAAGSHPRIRMQGLAELGRESRTQSSFKRCADLASQMVWDEFLSSPGDPYKLNPTQVIALGKVWGFLRFFW